MQAHYLRDNTGLQLVPFNVLNLIKSNKKMSCVLRYNVNYLSKIVTSEEKKSEEPILFIAFCTKIKICKGVPFWEIP